MLENESSFENESSWPQSHLVEIVGIKIESLRALRACNELGQSRVRMSHDFQSNFYNIQSKSLIVSSRGETSGVK